MHNPMLAFKQKWKSGTRTLLAGAAALAFALAGQDSGATTPTGALANARYGHAAANLPDGRVLIVGGRTSTSSIGMTANAELYDPATGTYASAAALAAARADHAIATLPDGRILVVGGSGVSGGSSVDLASAEIYDPATGAWTTTGAMATPRRSPLALTLADGKVLVVGGDSAAAAASTEVFDPASGTFSPSGALVAPRVAPVGAVLADGRVLIAGGNAPTTGTTYASAETRDPTTGAWSATGSMGYARYRATATTLANGKVLVAGGYAGGSYPAIAELFDPASGTFAATGAMVAPRWLHVAAKLPDGSVLVSGGSASSGGDVNEIYDVATGNWRAGGWMSAARSLHTLAPLPSGNLLIAGGAGSPLADSEIFYPSCVASINPISPTSQGFASPGGSGSVSLTAPANCGWSITRVPSWMTVTSGLSGMGSATISYSVAPMTTTGGRGATLRVADNNFAVNQTGVCDPASTGSFYPTSRSFTDAGGSDSISVYYSSSCQLTATNVPSWITITGGTGGYGSGTVTYTVAPNTGAYRYATMRVGNKNYQVTQNAAPPVCDPAYVPTLTPASQTFAAGGGSVTVNTTQSAGCTLAVSGVPAWITVTSTFSYTDSGVRYGQVGLSIASNTTGAARSATLTIATKSFVVTQNP